MKCSEVERILPDVLDDASEGALPLELQAHVETCPACSDLVADLRLIASEARTLGESEEPSPRLWVRIAAELRAEGLIREPETAPSRPRLIAASGRRSWSAWWLAPVAAALVAAGAYVVAHRPAPQVAKQSPAGTVTASAPAAPASTVAPTAQTESDKGTAPQPQAPAREQVGRTKPKRLGPEPNADANSELEASAEDNQFLSAVSTLAPSARATYESQLRAVNADIRETEAYVSRHPEDLDARQHLMDAYQQKALLYQIALDRIQ
jgi:hypothetical protein